MAIIRAMVPGGNPIFPNLEKACSLNITSPIHRLNPKSKIAVFVSMIILCSTVDSFSPIIYTVYLFYLAVVLLFSRLPLIGILKRSGTVVLFVVLVSGFIPFVRHMQGEIPVLIDFNSTGVYRTGLLIFLNILFRAYIDIIALLILISTNSFSMIIQGFAELRVPSVIVNIISITYRYLYVITDEAFRMKRAVNARGYSGKWIWNAGVFGKIIGNLFLRSYERSERVYWAMLSRGYNGTMFGEKTGGFETSDWIFLGVSLPFVLMVRIFL